MLALATQRDAVHLMKIAWLQTVHILASAVLTAIYMKTVAMTLSTYAHRVSENMSLSTPTMVCCY